MAPLPTPTRVADSTAAARDTPPQEPYHKELDLIASLQPTQLCLEACVSRFYCQRLMPWERRCVERCAQKYSAVQRHREAATNDAEAEAVVHDLERRMGLR